MSQGTLRPITVEDVGNRAFGFKIENVTGPATINISFNSQSIITVRGNRVSSVGPVAVLYDPLRPEVRLRTRSRRTRQHTIPISIEFSKPVLGFNESSNNISISGGRLIGFEERNRAKYIVWIQADDDVVYVNVVENVAEDDYGNKNQAAAAPLEVWHYSERLLSRVTSTIVTSTFGLTCLAHGMLAVSSASLLSTGAISGVPSSLMSDPAANLFLSLSHIQLIALSRWLPVNLPVEYSEYARALQWSIPYFNLPWEKDHVPLQVHEKEIATTDSSNIEACLGGEEEEEEEGKEEQKELNSHKAASMVQKSVQHRSPSASTIASESTKAVKSQYNECQEAEKARKDFDRSMFWLVVIGGGVILLHTLLILVVKIRWPQEQTKPQEQKDLRELQIQTEPHEQTKPQEQKDLREPQIQTEPQEQRDLREPQEQKDLREPQIQTEPQEQRDLREPQEEMELQEQKDLRESQIRTEPQEQTEKEKRDYGVLTFPRFEIFCIIVALSCICKASAGLIRGEKGSIAGGVLLGVVGLILLSSFIFLLVGITLGMLFLYDEKLDHQKAQPVQKKPKLFIRIGRLALGPGVEGEWKLKNKSKVFYLRILGPLFEDLRGLRSDMLPLNHGHNKTKDIEATGGSHHKSVDRSIPSNVEIKHVQEPGGDSQKNGDGITASVDKTGDTTGPEGNLPKNGDHTITSEDKTGENKYGDFLQKFLGILRTYYILLESVRQVILGTLAGAYAHNELSKTPPIIMLSITLFLLIFIVLLKPFVSKRGRVVETISIVCEVGVFTLTLLPLVKTCSPDEMTRIADCMVLLPFIGYSAAMINQFYALYEQIKDLDQDHQDPNKSFVSGLKTAYSGFAIFFCLKIMEKVDGNFPRTDPGNGGIGTTASSANTKGSSTTTDEAGRKQPSQSTKPFSSFTEQGNGAPNDTSSTIGNPSIPPPSELGRY